MSALGLSGAVWVERAGGADGRRATAAGAKQAEGQQADKVRRPREGRRVGVAARRHPERQIPRGGRGGLLLPAPVRVPLGIVWGPLPSMTMIAALAPRVLACGWAFLRVGAMLLFL